MIEISIFGANYGETIIISFGPKGGRRKYGLIDCFPLERKVDFNPIVKYLSERTEKLSFVIATHPHDDHIRGLAQVLEAYQDRVEFFGWWGGMDPDFQTRYFEKLQEINKNGLIRAKQISALISTLKKRHIRLNVWHTSTDGKPDPFYSDEKFSMVAISPWFPEKASYNRGLLTRIDRFTKFKKDSCKPNQTSLGFLIKYDKARILLPGDMERANWKSVIEENPSIFDGGVHFVKIPHHGSDTGRHQDLWSGKRKLPLGTSRRTVAVTTRCENGATRLPTMKVLNEIKESGCETWIIGGKESSSLINERHMASGEIRPRVLSRFTVQIDSSGRVQIIKDMHHLENNLLL